MKRDSPSPTVRFFLGEARIVVESLVQEFVGTIWQIAPGQGGDHVDHNPKFVFGDLHFGRALLRFPISWRRSKISGRSLSQGGTGCTSGALLGFRYEPSSPFLPRDAVASRILLEAQILPCSNASFKFLELLMHWQADDRNNMDIRISGSSGTPDSPKTDSRPWRIGSTANR